MRLLRAKPDITVLISLVICMYVCMHACMYMFIYTHDIRYMHTLSVIE